jgi:hypothetical protein
MEVNIVGLSEESKEIVLNCLNNLIEGKMDEIEPFSFDLVPLLAKHLSSENGEIVFKSAVVWNYCF